MPVFSLPRLPPSRVELGVEDELALTPSSGVPGVDGGKLDRVIPLAIIFALAAPLIPPAKRGGRKREANVREILNAIFYVLWTGCQWKALPKDFPPKSTVHDYLMLWDWDGTLERIHHALYVVIKSARTCFKAGSAGAMQRPNPAWLDICAYLNPASKKPSTNIGRVFFLVREERLATWKTQLL